MELRQLKYFIKSAETENFSQAAKECFVVQSTLSQQIKQLEDDLGTVIENEPIDKKLSQKELTEKVLQSWINLDASIMEPYFDKDMHYKSDRVFNEMSSSLEYSTYIEHKFDVIRNSQSKLTLGFGANTQTGEYAMLIKQPSVSQSTSVMQVKTKDGRITFLHLAELKRN